MQEFKGTKGSWSYDEVTGTIRGDGGLLAELLINGSEDHNGVLMASAPELLEALKGLLVRVADDEEYGPEHAITIAREAIKKALGK
ncbi:TPA: hypothetical protein ACG0BQ_000633 [Klebsiella pneumoniae]|uniref:hypothetical protein n=1 Tax=Klebsiella pneumoniae TaxID=573 RepID=UPI000E2C6D3E|nr:hypothetical protein [Klebsiella pneumoniae]HBQ5946556.1 hypothetical protein [Klebsiella pneumoniae subsp. pneumoniae]MEA4701098.1 hypothetical protein [Klebsiella pneumoniae]SYH02590.1 Uncharacterised protein [Klebsiella pneumoniae]SYH21111.1 Uncharacterised protein [Klebsiella pneumoniae]VVJ49916.1 Uncharacterised protein [Klebsiella pneumoniae]